MATFGDYFNQKVDNLSINIKEIKINEDMLYLLNKIPFDCKIVTIT